MRPTFPITPQDKDRLLRSIVFEVGACFDHDRANLSALARVLLWDRRKVIAGLHALQEAGRLTASRRTLRRPKRWRIVEDAFLQASGDSGCLRVE